MNSIQKIIAIAALSGAVGATALADATVEQHTEFHLTGALGTMVNVFGGRAAREGVTSSTAIRGDRKSTITGSSGTIVDLKEEKVYTLDYERKTYKVETFDEIRKRMEEAKERAAKHKSDDAGKSKPEGPEYEVDFTMKSTGQKQKINGWDTHEEVVTVTVREKGKKLEESGGAVLTADMWMGPKIAAMKELGDFEVRYFKKLYGGMFSVGDAQQMAMMLAASPAFGKAMKAFGEKRGSLEGTAIRTEMKLETVADPRAKSDDDSSSSAGGVMGGLLGKMKKRRSDDEPSAGAGGRSTFFTSTTEVLKATGTAAPSDVAMPAGFKLR
jgi:hypothetical protein